MATAERQANERVGIKIDILRHFGGKQRYRVHVQTRGKGVVVNWTMSGRNNFIAKAPSAFKNMDKMVGADFEKGLSQMNRLPKQLRNRARRQVSGPYDLKSLEAFRSRNNQTDGR